MLRPILTTLSNCAGVAARGVAGVGAGGRPDAGGHSVSTASTARDSLHLQQIEREIERSNTSQTNTSSLFQLLSFFPAHVAVNNFFKIFLK